MRTIITSCFLLHCLMVISQTYIGLSGGRSWSHIEGYSEAAFPINDVITEDGYKRKSLIYGFRVDQHVNDNFIISLTGQLTNKIAKYSDSGIVGYTDVKYNVKSGSIILQANPFADWYLGLGFRYNLLNRFRYGKEDRGIWSDPWPKTYNVNQYNVLLATNYRFKGFILECRWVKGAKTFGDFDLNYSIKNMNSFEIDLGYVIKIFGLKKE